MREVSARSVENPCMSTCLSMCTSMCIVHPNPMAANLNLANDGDMFMEYN
ncbi:MAG: hypothetical protein N4A62_01770 [Marinisporobacter sp.]|jgi:hypothetical protein|nr:hypothetical protein [Marinisporobacter sp.]